MLKELFSYMKQYKKYAWISLVCIAVECIFELVIPLIMADMVDVGIANGDKDYIAVYKRQVERLADTDIAMMEINVSCPNVKEGASAFGQKADALFDITSRIKKAAKQPVMMKLSPNVTDITEMAKAAEAGGADAISLIHTLRCV